MAKTPKTFRMAIRGRIDKQGRIVIPTEIRKELGFQPDEPLSLVVEDNSLRILTVDQAIKNAQAIAREVYGERTGIVDEFLRERRQDSGE